MERRASVRSRSIALTLLFACGAPTPTPRPASGGAATVAPGDAGVVSSTTPSDAPVTATSATTARLSLGMDDTMGDGEKRCAKALPSCAHVFAELEGPPHPCANKGTRCMEPVPPPTGWLCKCAECRSDADCATGTHCEIGVESCPTRRKPGVCRAGPNPGQQLCPEPP